MIEIRINSVPPSLNRVVGRNPWQYRDEKADWTRMVYMIARQKKPAKPIDKASVVITYHFPDKKRRDPDNFCGKFILDGLTKAGIIVDDSFEHISLRLYAGAISKPPYTIVQIFDGSLPPRGGSILRQARKDFEENE